MRALQAITEFFSPPPPPPPAPFFDTQTIATIVIATVLGEFILTGCATLLNIGALSSSMPLEFAGTYDSAAYARSQAYTRTKSAFSLAERTFDLCVLFLFWLQFDGFDVLDQWVASTLPGAPIRQGLLYFGAITVGSSVLGLPWSIYSTFVIEEAYGFNKTTPKTFVLDLLKGLGLFLVLGPPIGGAILWFFTNAGELAWLYCWGTLAAFQLLLMFVLPVWILPLFNKFTPLPEGELKRAIEAYAATVGFRFGGIYEIDGSTRSSHSNAFFTGFGATKRIALFDTLVKQASTQELVAILAHEVGHEKKGHIVWSIAFSLCYTFALLYLMSLFLSFPPLFAAFSVSRTSVHVGLVLFQLLFSPVDTFLQVLLTMRSRANEFEADRYSVETYRNSEALVSGLKKLSKENLSNLTPHPLHVFLTYSHPPILERLAALRAHASRLASSSPRQKGKR